MIFNVQYPFYFQRVKLKVKSNDMAQISRRRTKYDEDKCFQVNQLKQNYASLNLTVSDDIAGFPFEMLN